MREDMYDTAKAAEYLGISPNTLGAWCSAKNIPYHLVGGKRRFKKADLDQKIEDGRIEAAQ